MSYVRVQLRDAAKTGIYGTLPQAEYAEWITQLTEKAESVGVPDSHLVSGYMNPELLLDIIERFDILLITQRVIFWRAVHEG